SAGGLPKHRDVIGISAELCDVVMHPLQRRDLIENRVVSRSVMAGFLREFRMCKEAKDIETVVGRDQDDAVIYQRSIFVEVRRCRSTRVCAAVDPEHYRQRLLYGPLRRDDVQIQTILFAYLSVVAIPVAG